MKRFSTNDVAINAVIAALYFAVSFFTHPISFSPVFQIRLSEALTILPFVFPNCYIGLTIGCVLANLQSPFGILDIILGSFITLVAGIITSKIKKVWLAPLPPVILNAVFLPLVWMLCGASDVVYTINVLSLIASQSLVLYILGIPLALISKKSITPFFRK